MPWWKSSKSSSSSPKKTSSSTKKDISSFFNRTRSSSSSTSSIPSTADDASAASDGPRLTRLSKIRGDSTPVSRSPSRNDYDLSFSASALPLPLPERDRGGECSSNSTNEFSYQTVRKSTDCITVPSNKSMFSNYKKASWEPHSAGNEKSHLYVPFKSAPTSTYSSPSLSPTRGLSNVDYLPTHISPPVQMWSAPEISSKETLTGSSYHTSFHINSDRYSSCSSANRSPSGRSRNHSSSPSPQHPKLCSNGHSIWHESNGSGNVHPLPLPPGAASPPQSSFSASPPQSSFAASPPESSFAASPPQPTFCHPNTVQTSESPWQKQKLIGSGTFGNVYVATNRHTGALCAMKEVNIIPDDPKSVECIKQLEQEIKVLSHLKHPNIVQYYGSETIDDRFYIYLEYVYPGAINKYVQGYCGAMTESVVRNFTRHILRGLAYLHSTKNIHRDIKGANLLVDIKGVVKLADFGMAKHLTGAAAALSLRGTPYWMAPEVVQATMNKDIGYDYAVDIWSLGCTIIEMFTGKHPWNGLEGAAAMFKVLHNDPPIPDTLSSEGKDFLQRCFRRNPAERPTATMLLEHPFIKNSHHHKVHGSIHAFAGLKLDNSYSVKDRTKSKSQNGVKGKQSYNVNTSQFHPETSNLPSRGFTRSMPEVTRGLSERGNNLSSSRSSSSDDPNGMPVTGENHQLYALPKPK